MRAIAEASRNVMASVLLAALLSSGVQGQQVTGKGEWQSLTSPVIQGTWTASLKRQGGHVTGTLALAGSNVFSGGSVSGDIDGSNVMLGIMAQGARQATFNGQLEDGTVKGEWDLDCDVLKDHGVWSGTLTLGPPSRTTP